jgi:glutamate dehydrogenase
MSLYDDLLDSDLPEDPCLLDELVNYFPKPLQKRFPEAIRTHGLRREIVATVVCNEIINRVGITFVHEVREKTGHSPAEIGRAFLIARTIFDMTSLWGEIEALDNQVPTRAQAVMLAECGRLMDRATVWFLRNREIPLNVGEETDVFGAGIADLKENCELLLCSDQQRTLDARMKVLAKAGATPEIAEKVARLSLMVPACDIVLLARESKLPVQKVAETYFGVGSRFGFNWLRRATQRLPSDTAWEKLALTALVDDLDGHQRNLAHRILEAPNGNRTAEEAIEIWAATRGPQVTRAEQLMLELQSHPNLDFAMLAVASRQLNAIVG